MARVKSLLEAASSAEPERAPRSATTPRWKPSRTVEAWDADAAKAREDRKDLVRLGYVWGTIVVVIATFAFLSHFGVL